MKGMPMSISVEPTTSCNLRCPECPSGLRAFTRPTGMLQQEKFKHLINQLAPNLLNLTFYFQGEPYLNPDFLDMVSYANQKKVYTSTSTNAHYLTDENAKKTIESGLDRIIISIDGTDQATYENYRIGGKLEEVIAGTKRLVKAKKEAKSRHPHIVFQFLVVKPNEHQIEEVQNLAKEIGVDEVALKSAQIYDYENGSPLIPENEKYARYVKKGDKYIMKGKQENSCWKMWHSCVFTWDGDVVPCCFDKDATHVLGNWDNNFKEVWRGPKYNNLRQALLKSRSSIEICKNCTEGTKVWV